MERTLQSPSVRARCLAALIICALTSCTRQLRPEAAVAAIQASDWLTVHDADRLLLRLATAQEQLGPELVDSPTVPEVLQWELVSPQPLSEDVLQDVEDNGQLLPALLLIATQTIQSPQVGRLTSADARESVLTDATSDTTSSDARNGTSPADGGLPPAAPETGTQKKEVARKSPAEALAEPTPMAPISSEIERYFALWPLNGTSSGLWPVVRIEAGSATVVASNLRDCFALSLLDAPDGSPSEPAQAPLRARLWNHLRLGIVDEGATLQRLDRAITLFRAAVLQTD